MKITKVRDLLAGFFAIVLILVLICGILMAMGKPIPFVDSLIGR